MGQLSTRIDLPFPIFDADNHLYEPPEAMTNTCRRSTRTSSSTCRSTAVPRSRCAVRSATTSPTRPSRVVAKPGAWEEYFKYGNPEGKSKRELFGESRCARSRPSSSPAAPGGDGLPRPGPHPDVPDHGQRRRGAAARRSGRDPRHHPRAERWLADVWGFNYENRIFTTPVITPCRSSKGNRGTGVGGQARCPLHPDPPGAGARLPRPRSFALPEFDPFWERVVGLTCSSACTPVTAATPATPRSGTARRREMLPFQTNAMSILNGGAPSGMRWPPA